MALAMYSDLTTALSVWATRPEFVANDTDEAILISEAAANRKLAHDFRRRSTATVNTNSSGVGTLPTGFVGLTSVTRNVLGSLPLTQVSYGAFIEDNPYRDSDDAQVFSLLTATTFAVSPVTDDDFIFYYSGSVPALSSGNTTNWLLTLAPDYYLFMGRSVLLKKYEDYQQAALYEQMAMGVLNEIVAQGNVAEFGNAGISLNFVTP